MPAYKLARGCTFPLTVVIQKVLGAGLAPVPVNITGWRVVFTVRTSLIDGTTDVTVPPLFQADNLLLGGVTLAPQPTTLPNGVVSLGVCYIVMPESATQGPVANPFASPTRLYYDIMVNDGIGDAFQTEFGTIQLGPRVMLSEP
jgi:hypothetical protein